jgi:hypothetical protein
MYTVSPILSTLNIGDSLPFINANYLSLDLWTYNIELSAKKYWRPLVDLFLNKSDEWDKSITIAQQNSAMWIDMSTVVEQNSAKWIEPLTIYYPGIFTQGSSIKDIVTTVNTWANNNFPVRIENSLNTFYLQNQELIIYNFIHKTERVVKDHKVVEDSTKCVTADGFIHTKCVTEFHGYVFCSNGDMNCEGQATSCPYTEYVDCYFNQRPEGPYEATYGTITVWEEQEPIITITYDDEGNEVSREEEVVPPKRISTQGTDNTNVYSRIKATFDVNYTDTREQTDIIAVKFKVSDCTWVYNGVIGSAQSAPDTTPLLAYNLPPQPPGVTPTDLELPTSSLIDTSRYLPAGSNLTWIVPPGIYRIRFTLSGSGGRGGTGYKGISSQGKPVPGGAVSLVNGFLTGADGDIGGANYGYPQIGNGLAGGGGASAATQPSGYAKGGAGGGGGGWAQKTLSVTPGQIFKYTTGIPYIASTIQSNDWRIAALAGAKGMDGTDPLTGAVIYGGDGGDVTGDYDVKIKGENGSNGNGVYGGNGGRTRDVSGNLSNYGGYINIEFLPNL